MSHLLGELAEEEGIDIDDKVAFPLDELRQADSEDGGHEISGSRGERLEGTRILARGGDVCAVQMEHEEETHRVVIKRA